MKECERMLFGFLSRRIERGMAFCLMYMLEKESFVW